jgi:hypothetical protein
MIMSSATRIASARDCEMVVLPNSGDNANDCRTVYGSTGVDDRIDVVLAKAGDNRFVQRVRNRISRIIDGPD